MLTKEILLANSTLAGLSAEQLEAIATLSQNDEAAVIAKKTSDIYGGLDADILVASGVEKNGGEKTYDYAKRVIGTLKKSVDGAKGNAEKIAALEAEKAKLQAELEKGGGEEHHMSGNTYLNRRSVHDGSPLIVIVVQHFLLLIIVQSIHIRLWSSRKKFLFMCGVRSLHVNAVMGLVILGDDKRVLSCFLQVLQFFSTNLEQLV